MTQEQLIETVLLRLADGLPHSLADINTDDLACALQQLDAWGLQPSQDEYSRYSIVRRLNLLDQAAINRTLFQHKLQRTQQDTQQGSVLVFRSLDSTNEFLLTQKDLPSGTICTTEMQTAGRGRRGRQWHSPFAQNLYFSLLWHFQTQPEKLKALSLVVGICVADTLTELGVENIRLKWPNDIYLNGRKLGGILIESRIFNQQSQQMVIGIGLNLAMQPSDAEQISQPWANLNESAVKIERNQLVATLASRLQQALQQLEQCNSSHYLQRWQQYDYFYQQPIKLLLEQEEIHGICCGIDTDSGELLLKTEDGRIHHFNIGEISVRALHNQKI